MVTKKEKSFHIAFFMKFRVFFSFLSNITHYQLHMILRNNANEVAEVYRRERLKRMT
jgi:hypothetical protein